MPEGLCPDDDDPALFSVDMDTGRQLVCIGKQLMSTVRYTKSEKLPICRCIELFEALAKFKHENTGKPGFRKRKAWTYLSSFISVPDPLALR